MMEATAMLGRAFESDPMFTYLLPQPKARSRVVPAFFGMVASYSRAYGVLDMAPDVQGAPEVKGTAVIGAACWLRPGHTAPAALRLLHLGWPRWTLYRAMFTLGVEGLRRLSALAAFADQQHRQAAPGPHWYLWALGVDPACQRQGVGTQLLRPGLARADAEHLPCYLETNNVLNLIFYQKYGFKVVTRSQPEGHELTFWAMRRDPQ